MKDVEDWIVQIGDVYLKHPSGPIITKNPKEAYGCHYKTTALEYLKEFGKSNPLISRETLFYSHQVLRRRQGVQLGA